MSQNIQQLLEAKSREITDRNKGLVKSWDRYISAVNSLVTARDGRPLQEHQKSVIARCLENALIDGGMKQGKKLFETTYQSDIAFLGIQLPVIAALIPSLALNDVAVIQALDRRQGAVFYMDVNYGTTKGDTTAGTAMVSALGGHARASAGNLLYASNRISNEVAGTGNGTTKIFTYTLSIKPNIVAGSVILTAATNAGGTTSETFTDNGLGTLTSDGATPGTGTVDYTTGVITTATFFVAPANGKSVLASYKVDMGKNTAAIGEVNFKLTSSNLSAEDFKLRSLYEMGAAIDLEKAHGIVFDEEVVKFLGAEIKFEIDHFGLSQIVDASQTSLAAGGIAGIGAWNASVAAGSEWVWKKYEFLDFIEKGNNQILTKTLRAYATYIICGVDVARVLRQMDPQFKAESAIGKAPAGPHKIGVLNGRDVILDPFMAASTYTLGFKGDSMLYGSFLYAPYIPLFATPTLVTADLLAQKGFMSAAGYKVLNTGMLTYGTVNSLLS